MIDRIKRFLIAQDCWYLLSGLLMLLGCYLMSQAPGADSVELGAGLRLQGVVLLYQIAVVGLAVFVRKRLGVESDGFNLACVALVLLPDPTFFTTRFWGHSHSAGLAVNAVALIASALMLVFLSEAGGFPIRGRAMAAWLTLLVIVYGGGALFDPGQSSANGLAMDVMVFAPLLLATLAGGFDMGDRRDGPRNERLAAHPVLWGDPSRIYNRYLASIVLGYPFFIMLRHLYGLGAVFLQDIDLARCAPAILGVAVLLVRAKPKMASNTGLLGAIGLFSMAAAGTREHGALPLFQLMVAANLSFGLWIHWLENRQEFPVHATLCTALFFAGNTPSRAMEGLLTLQAGPLAVFAIASAIYAIRDRGFWEVYAAGACALALFFRVAPLPGGLALGGFVHAAAILYLVCVHNYPRKDLYGSCGVVASLMVLSLLPGAHGYHGELFKIVLACEAVGIFLAGVSTPVKSYLPIAIGATGFEVVTAAGPAAAALDFGRMFWSWSGPVSVLLAFATLAVGLAGSKAKSQA